MANKITVLIGEDTALLEKEANTLWELKVRKFDVYSKYPETKSHPTVQHAIVNEMKLNINRGRRILVITHSPYILTCLNNLMLAYTVGQMKPKKVSKIIPKELWLDPASVEAYECTTDGLVDIFEHFTQMIRAEAIDKISERLNDEIDKLLDIKVAYEKKQREKE